MNPRAARWLLSRDTGLSSIAIVAFMEGAGEEAKYQHPQDPDDLGRCIRLLSFVPEYRARLQEMKAASPQWAVLIEHWDAIEKLYFLEFPTGSAPACYARMRDLLDSIPWRPNNVPMDILVKLISHSGKRGRITSAKWMKVDYGYAKYWDWRYTFQADDLVLEGFHREGFDIIEEETSAETTN